MWIRGFPTSAETKGSGERICRWRSSGSALSRSPIRSGFSAIRSSHGAFTAIGAISTGERSRTPVFTCCCHGRRRSRTGGSSSPVTWTATSRRRASTRRASRSVTALSTGGNASTVAGTRRGRQTMLKSPLTTHPCVRPVRCRRARGVEAWRARTCGCSTTARGSATGTEAQEKRLIAWAGGAVRRQRKLVVIECGAGRAIPSVRNLSNKFAAIGAPLVRINPREPGGPDGTISVPLWCAGGIEADRADPVAVQRQTFRLISGKQKELARRPLKLALIQRSLAAEFL